MTRSPHAARSSRHSAPSRREMWWLFAAITVFGAIWPVIRAVESTRERPSEAQLIAAQLIAWGQDNGRILPPISQQEIDRHVELLRSPVSEERVAAAQWLGERGIRDRGPDIVAAMYAPGTYRPCQLAHELGSLGDPQWIGVLTEAALQPTNSDLRVCATVALCDLASSDSIDSLIRVYREGTARVIALRALGEIADPAALPFLETVAASPPTPQERQAAEEAISRIELLRAPDPLPALAQRFEADLAEGRVDPWATRQLARLADPRGVALLSRAISHPHADSRSERVALAAALLAHGPEGTAALEKVLAHDAPTDAPIQRIARAALMLTDSAPLARSRSSR